MKHGGVMGGGRKRCSGRKKITPMGSIRVSMMAWAAHPFEQSKEGWPSERVQGCWGNKALRDRLAGRRKAVAGECEGSKGKRKERQRGSAGRSRVCLSARVDVRVRACVRMRVVVEVVSCARVPWNTGFQPKSDCEKRKKKKKSSWRGAALRTLTCHAKEQQRAAAYSMHIASRRSLGRWGES